MEDQNQQTTATYSNVVEIKKFFEANGGKPVSMAEMKALSAEDRTQLGDMAARANGTI